MTNTTDFDYKMDIDNDGEIRLVERDIEGGVIGVMYLSQRDVENMVGSMKEFENESA